MKTLSLASVISVACVALFAGGVPAEASELSDVASLESASVSALPSVFKLYPEPGATPTPDCDIHTRLDLVVGPRTGRAVLNEVVTGSCDTHVFPNERVYPFQLTEEPCGSKVYEGARTTPEGLARIRITDHRTRRCRDIVPAKIIVEESVPTPAGRQSMTKYSYDGPAVDGS